MVLVGIINFQILGVKGLTKIMVIGNYASTPFTPLPPCPLAMLIWILKIIVNRCILFQHCLGGGGNFQRSYGTFSPVNEGVPIPFGQECSSQRVYKQRARCLPFRLENSELSGQPLLTHSAAKRNFRSFHATKTTFRSAGLISIDHQNDKSHMHIWIKLGACVIESLWLFILTVAVPYLRFYLMTSTLSIFAGYYRSLLILIA